MIAPPGLVWGTDVSALQGVVPFDELARMGASFAWMRCKIGNDPGRDSRFVANVNAAKKAGIFPGAYVFAYPLPHLDPREQAAGFIEAARVGVDGDPLGSWRGELPIALDLEWPPPQGLKKPDGTVGKGWAEWGCTAPQIREWSLACLAELADRLGYKPAVYTYPHFAKALFAGAPKSELDEFARFPLWAAGGPLYGGKVARFPDLATERPPVIPPWQDWTAWQFDGNGGARLPNGVDADFNVFNGTIEDLRAFVGLARRPTPAPPPPARDALTSALHAMVDESVREYRLGRDNGDA